MSVLQALYFSTFMLICYCDLFISEIESTDMMYSRISELLVVYFISTLTLSELADH